MQPAELLKYIEDPQLLNQQSVKDLQQLVADFPYFQPAHLLLSMAAKKWDASVYQQSLKKTAIVATNRSHLFHLIHQLETQRETEQIKGSEKEIEKKSGTEQPSVSKKETTHELDILKATEVSSEQLNDSKAEKEVAVEVATDLVLETPVDLVALKPKPDPEEILEKEIQNQVVNSFVEKEILKTPELHHPKQKEEPESFVEWLSLIKKNNGQSYRQINEQVNAEKIRQKTAKPAEEKKPEQISPALQGKKEKNRALIDKIIESSPGIIRSKEDQKFFTATNHAKESLLENEHLVTEDIGKNLRFARQCK